MKISVFTDLRFTECQTPTGVGKHIAHMVQGLASIEGNRVSILAARDQASGNKLRPASALSSLPVSRLPLPWKAAEALWTLTGGPAVDNYCGGADWVYCPKNDFVPLRHTRLAVTIHGAHELDPQMPKSMDVRARLNRARRLLSYRRITERASLVLTVSNFLKGQIVDWFGCDENKITVVGNGVEQEFFAAADQPLGTSGRSLDSPYLLSVGGLNDIDGGDRVLEVAKLLKRMQSKIHIVVAGWQHEKKHLDVAAKLGNVELLGYVPTNRLAPLMRDAQALLFLTRYETFGIAAAEAMAAGTPVITCGGTAVPEIVGDIGLYVSEDPEDAIAKISKLTADQQLHETLRVAGRARAEEFAWGACVGRLNAAFSKAG